MVDRTVKFRLWNDKEKRMVYKGMLTFDMADGEWSHESIRGSFHSHFGKLMEYTSLSDKNGKNICEGDIVSFMYREETKIGIVGKSEYDTWCLMVQKPTLLKDDGEIKYHVDYAIKGEIIGNIHEECKHEWVSSVAYKGAKICTKCQKLM